MFVSSYSTYIHTNSTDKTSNTNKASSAKETSTKAFSKYLHTSQLAQQSLKNTPINYIDNSKIFQNRQKLQQNLESQKEASSVVKFNYKAAIKPASLAYSANSMMFSLVAKPKPSIPTQALNMQGNKEVVNDKKTLVINTYIANDSYYRITA